MFATSLKSEQPLSSAQLEQLSSNNLLKTALVVSAVIFVVLGVIGITGILHSTGVITLPHALSWIAPIGTVGQACLTATAAVSLALSIVSSVKLYRANRQAVSVGSGVETLNSAAQGSQGADNAPPAIPADLSAVSQGSQGADNAPPASSSAPIRPPMPPTDPSTMSPGGQGADNAPPPASSSVVTSSPAIPAGPPTASKGSLSAGGLSLPSSPAPASRSPSLGLPTTHDDAAGEQLSRTSTSLSPVLGANATIDLSTLPWLDECPEVANIDNPEEFFATLLVNTGSGAFCVCEAFDDHTKNWNYHCFNTGNDDSMVLIIKAAKREAKDQLTLSYALVPYSNVESVQQTLKHAGLTEYYYPGTELAEANTRPNLVWAEACPKGFLIKDQEQETLLQTTHAFYLFDNYDTTQQMLVPILTDNGQALIIQCRDVDGTPTLSYTLVPHDQLDNVVSYLKDACGLTYLYYPGNEPEEEGSQGAASVSSAEGAAWQSEEEEEEEEEGAASEAESAASQISIASTSVVAHAQPEKSPIVWRSQYPYGNLTNPDAFFSALQPKCFCIDENDADADERLMMVFRRRDSNLYYGLFPKAELQVVLDRYGPKARPNKQFTRMDFPKVAPLAWVGEYPQLPPSQASGALTKAPSFASLKPGTYCIDYHFPDPAGKRLVIFREPEEPVGAPGGGADADTTVTVPGLPPLKYCLIAQDELDRSVVGSVQVTSVLYPSSDDPVLRQGPTDNPLFATLATPPATGPLSATVGASGVAVKLDAEKSSLDAWLQRAREVDSFKTYQDMEGNKYNVTDLKAYAKGLDMDLNSCMARKITTPEDASVSYYFICFNTAQGELLCFPPLMHEEAQKLVSRLKSELSATRFKKQ